MTCRARSRSDPVYQQRVGSRVDLPDRAVEAQVGHLGGEGVGECLRSSRVAERGDVDGIARDLLHLRQARGIRRLIPRVAVAVLGEGAESEGAELVRDEHIRRPEPGRPEVERRSVPGGHGQQPSPGALPSLDHHRVDAGRGQRRGSAQPRDAGSDDEHVVHPGPPFPERRGRAHGRSTSRNRASPRRSVSTAWSASTSGRVSVHGRMPCSTAKRIASWMSTGLPVT